MDKMREAFERWAKSECIDTDSVDGFYSDNDTHIAWGSWQAAQSAAVPVVGEVVAYADDVKQLMQFYAVSDLISLSRIQSEHIARLQKKLPTMRDEQQRNPRSGGE